MNPEISNAENTLIQERATALHTYREKIAAANEAAAAYERLDAAIAVLTGTPKENAVATSQTVKKTRKRSRRKESPPATKEQVQPALKNVVSLNPGITGDEAEELVKHHLKEHGLGIIGVSAQVRKYLTAEEFTIDEAGRVSLAALAVDDSANALA